MRYFIIDVDKRYTDAPTIINWYNKINIDNIKNGIYYNISKRTLLPLRANENIVFIDIIVKPTFLISDKLRKIFEIYDKYLKFKQVALLDSKNEKVELYHIPTIKSVDCLNEKTKFNRDKSIITECYIDYDKVKDLSIFHIKGIKTEYTVIRLDLLESILRRGARGISIKEINLVY